MAKICIGLHFRIKDKNCEKIIDTVNKNPQMLCSFDMDCSSLASLKSSNPHLIWKIRRGVQQEKFDILLNTYALSLPIMHTQTEFGLQLCFSKLQMSQTFSKTLPVFIPQCGAYHPALPTILSRNGIQCIGLPLEHAKHIPLSEIELYNVHRIRGHDGTIIPVIFYRSGQEFCSTNGAEIISNLTQRFKMVDRTLYFLIFFDMEQCPLGGIVEFLTLLSQTQVAYDSIYNFTRTHLRPTKDFYLDECLPINNIEPNSSKTQDLVKLNELLRTRMRNIDFFSDVLLSNKQAVEDVIDQNLMEQILNLQNNFSLEEQDTAKFITIENILQDKENILFKNSLPYILEKQAPKTEGFVLTNPYPAKVKIPIRIDIEMGDAKGIRWTDRFSNFEIVHSADKKATVLLVKELGGYENKTISFNFETRKTEIHALKEKGNSIENSHTKISFEKHNIIEFYDKRSKQILSIGEKKAFVNTKIYLSAYQDKTHTLQDIPVLRSRFIGKKVSKLALTLDYLVLYKKYDVKEFLTYRLYQDIPLLEIEKTLHLPCPCLGDIFPVNIISSIKRPRSILRNLSGFAVERRINTEDQTQNVLVNNWVSVSNNISNLLICSDTSVGALKQIIDINDEHNTLTLFYTSDKNQPLRHKYSYRIFIMVANAMSFAEVFNTGNCLSSGIRVGKVNGNEKG